MNARIFHCEFSNECQDISLQFFNCMPGYFIAIFQLYAWGFHCNFSIVCLGISLRFFKYMPWYFFAIFQLYAWGFHCDFSVVCLGTSLTSCLKGLFLNGDGTYLYLPNQKLRNISGTLERAPLFFFGPYNYIIIDLNKP